MKEEKDEEGPVGEEEEEEEEKGGEQPAAGGPEEVTRRSPRKARKRRRHLGEAMLLPVHESCRSSHLVRLLRWQPVQCRPLGLLLCRPHRQRVRARGSQGSSLYLLVWPLPRCRRAHPPHPQGVLPSPARKGQAEGRLQQHQPLCLWAPLPWPLWKMMPPWPRMHRWPVLHRKKLQTQLQLLRRLLLPLCPRHQNRLRLCSKLPR